MADQILYKSHPLIFREDAEQSLAGDQEGRAKKLVAKPQGSLRPPFLSPEAWRSRFTVSVIQIKI